MSDTNPLTIVIFGGTGDLAQRKLFPALFHLFCKQQLPTPFHLVAAATSTRSDEEVRNLLREGAVKLANLNLDEAQWDAFAQQISYVQVDLSNSADFEQLQHRLKTVEEGPANRLYHLAVAPELFMPAVTNMQAANMHQTEGGWRRLVIEKPFGYDLASAQELNTSIQSVFGEEAIFRIDHYLGKETAQNILFLRFANSIFEPLWNATYIENVQITVAEQIDVGERASYYDNTGVLRDMFQNHLLQLLALVAMEPPSGSTADALRDAKVALLRSIRPVKVADTVRGQYQGYQAAKGVADHSQTATYAALPLFINSQRWQGVPFYLRSGKALAEKSSEIVIEFKRPVQQLFALPADDGLEPDILYICIQPDEGVHLQFQAKQPGPRLETATVDLEFHYRTAFEGMALVDAYERLLLDAIQGDAMLFTRSDGIEAAWQVIDPILEGWQTADAPPLHVYTSGSWGPTAAEQLLASRGHRWRHGCCEHDT